MAAGRPFHCGFASIARSPLSSALGSVQVLSGLKRLAHNDKPFQAPDLALALSLLMRRFRVAVGFRIRQSAVLAEARSFIAV
jgi:hypothetical protein